MVTTLAEDKRRHERAEELFLSLLLESYITTGEVLRIMDRNF